MIASVLGAVIISMATVSMLIAIQITETAVKQAGKYPLTKEEKDIVLQVPVFNSSHISALQGDVQSLSLPSD